MNKKLLYVRIFKSQIIVNNRFISRSCQKTPLFSILHTADSINMALEKSHRVAHLNVNHIHCSSSVAQIKKCSLLVELYTAQVSRKVKKTVIVLDLADILAVT